MTQKSVFRAKAKRMRKRHSALSSRQSFFFRTQQLLNVVQQLVRTEPKEKNNVVHPKWDLKFFAIKIVFVQTELNLNS